MGLVAFNDVFGYLYKFHWVDRFGLVFYFIMQMRSGAPAGGAQVADQLATLDGIAPFDRSFEHMKITGTEAIAVVDNHIVAKAIGETTLGDNAVGCGLDRASPIILDINPFMERGAIVDGVHPFPEL